MNLPQYLSSTDSALSKAILALAEAVKEISVKIRTANADKAGSTNTFGEEQLALDVIADKIIFDELKKSEVVGLASSEEQSEEVTISEEESAELAVAFDPLDGSSLVDANLAVGTIFGIWKTRTFIGQTGNDLLASGYAVYGPRTTIIITKGEEPSEFTLQPNNEWLQTRADITIGEGKMFAPGNLRACADHEKYRQLVEFWMGEKYTLRYSGGMVPDVHQILSKGKGVFSYPASESAPAKLRLLYECAPLAKVVEAAGGLSLDGSQSILAKEITSLDERTPICLGSKEEVNRFKEYLS